MKFIFAPDSYKGTLSSPELIRLLKESASQVFPDCETVGVPIADGGEGTLEAVLPAVGGEYRQVAVKDPLGGGITAKYGVFCGKGLIEMASASGLTLIPAERRSPLRASSYGTGQLILDALEQGCRDIYVAVGGSATNDGGTGAMKALGVRFLDEQGHELDGTGANLIRIQKIDRSHLSPLVRGAEFHVMCDVTNPLLGPEGAIYVYGPQKGAGERELELLESGMAHYAEIAERDLKIPFGAAAGAGAAGGMGAALIGFLNAEVQSGVETVLRLVGFEDLLRGADLVVTGEGRVDFQSACGKAISGIAGMCRRHGVPVAVIAGEMGRGAEELYGAGVASIMATIGRAESAEEAAANAEADFRSASRRMFRLLKLGMEIGGGK